MESVFSLKKLFEVKIIQFVFKPKLSHILNFVINRETDEQPFYIFFCQNSPYTLIDGTENEQC